MDIPGLPPSLLSQLGAAAGDGRVALVGGAVRDLLLHRIHNDPWRGLPDLDLVVEGRASAFVSRLVGALPTPALLGLREHGQFGTVELEVVIDGQPVLLDVASARSETYRQPAENPRVSLGGLVDDLARRDFSINAIALDLRSGALLDPHGGQRDLQQRCLRLLHSSSIRDDPTRLVRGARYAARLGFALAAESEAQVRTTVKDWPWAWKHGHHPDQAPPALGTRLRMEMALLLEREPWSAALLALQHWGGLTLLDPHLQHDRHWRRRIRWGHRLDVPAMEALVAGARDPLALAKRLQMPHREQQHLAHWLALSSTMQGPGAARSVPAWCSLLEEQGHGPAAVALMLATGDGPRRPLLRWLLRWRQLRAPVSAQELIARGLPPGPGLGAELKRLRAERLAVERL
jgi:poly(A) polymerase